MIANELGRRLLFGMRFIASGDLPRFNDQTNFLCLTRLPFVDQLQDECVCCTRFVPDIAWLVRFSNDKPRHLRCVGRVKNFCIVVGGNFLGSHVVRASYFVLGAWYLYLFSAAKNQVQSSKIQIPKTKGPRPILLVFRHHFFSAAEDVAHHSFLRN